MKKVYVVKGSEDGNIAVFFAEKKALQRAMQYLFQDGETMAIDIEITTFCSSKRVTTKKSNVYAEVELWLV